VNQQSIAPVAKRTPILPFAVALVAALAYGAGVVTTTLVASNVSQPASAGQGAPIIRSVQTHRVVAGPNEY
jgi:hypothetical protein